MVHLVSMIIHWDGQILVELHRLLDFILRDFDIVDHWLIVWLIAVIACRCVDESCFVYHLHSISFMYMSE